MALGDTIMAKVRPKKISEEPRKEYEKTMKRAVKSPEVFYQSSMGVKIKRGPHVCSYLRHRNLFAIELIIAVLKVVHGALRCPFCNSSAL